MCSTKTAFLRLFCAVRGPHKELFCCHPFCLPQCNSDSCFLQKFSDDSAVAGGVRAGCEGEHRGTINDFVNWSNLKHLRLNVSKTKETALDFRRKRPKPDPVSIQGTEVQLVLSCRLDGWTTSWTGLATWRQSTKRVWCAGGRGLAHRTETDSINR